MRVRAGAIAVVVTVVVTAVVLAAAAAAAIPRSWYWSETRAATLVKKTVKIPCAKLVPNPNNLPPAASCATQPPSSIDGAAVSCHGRGTPPVRTRRFHRFLCSWDTANHVSWGSLMVYVSGASALRWKVLSA